MGKSIFPFYAELFTHSNVEQYEKNSIYRLELKNMVSYDIVI